MTCSHSRYGRNEVVNVVSVDVPALSMPKPNPATTANAALIMPPTQ